MKNDLELTAAHINCPRPIRQTEAYIVHFVELMCEASHSQIYLQE